MTTKDEQNYLELIKYLPDVVYRVNKKGIFTFLNNSVRQFGYEPVELIGKHFRTIMHPGDAEYVQRERVRLDYKGVETGADAAPKLFDEMRTGSRITKNLKIRVMRKEYLHLVDEPEKIEDSFFIKSEIISLGVHCFDEDGKSFTGTIGVIRDISSEDKSMDELIRLEKYHLMLLENASDIITVLANDGTMLYLSPSIKKILGYDQIDLIGENIYVFVHQDDKPIVEEFLDKGDKNSDEAQTIEYRFENKKGGFRSLVTVFKRIIDDSGSLAFYTLNSFDITENKKLLTELREARDELEDRVKERTRELETANKLLKESENRHRLAEERARILLEGSDDIIFSLDKEWNFLTASKAVQKYFHISPKEMVSKNFLDTLYVGLDEKSTIKELVREKLEIFAKTREPVQFKTEVRSFLSGEPKEMNIRLEYINIEGKNEILGKAFRIYEDELLKYFVSETQEFFIGNYLVNVDEVSQRITKNLLRYFDHKGIILLRLGLREIIINAIEHGNLEISYEEKSFEVMDGDFIELIMKRQRNPEFSKRRVHIEYSLNPEQVYYKITDEGKGFDYQKEFQRDGKGNIGSGRGVKLARQIFDEVSYSKKGNQVILVKRIEG
ncbi:MAG: PAS domain S-box protein [bacterium]|nr:PAS domain S-box protein [bacterium]